MNLRLSHDRIRELTPKNPLYRQWILQHTGAEAAKDSCALDGSPRGDVTAARLFSHPVRAKAAILSRESGILAGRQEIEFFLRREKLSCRFFVKDGARFGKNRRIAAISGDAGKIFLLERSVLNLLGRMSGVAAKTRLLAEQARRANPKIFLAATRKSFFGLLDKRAVALGGGITHRLNLSDAVLIKDNHLAVFGGNIPRAIAQLFPLPKNAKFFEIEVETADQAVRACEVLQKIIKEKKGAPVSAGVLLDNFSPQRIRKTLSIIRKLGLRRGIFFEASGGITVKNLRAFARTGVDLISLGELTKNAPSSDFSLEMLSSTST